MTRRSDIQDIQNNVIDNCLYTYNNLIINFQLHLILSLHKLAGLFMNEELNLRTTIILNSDTTTSYDIIEDHKIEIHWVEFIVQVLMLGD